MNNNSQSSLVLVDTSIWIQAFNCPGSPERFNVDKLIDQEVIATTGIVVAEVLQGARSRDEYLELAEVMKGPHYLDATPQVYYAAGALALDLRMRGQTTALSDVIIGAVVLEYGCFLYTLDTDFQRIQGLRWYSP